MQIGASVTRMVFKITMSNLVLTASAAGLIATMAMVHRNQKQEREVRVEPTTSVASDAFWRVVRAQTMHRAVIQDIKREQQEKAAAAAALQQQPGSGSASKS